MTTEPAHGLFGPGIFGSGIDLSALDEDTAWRLGIFMGEQLALAEQRGRERARSEAPAARRSVMTSRLRSLVVSFVDPNGVERRIALGVEGGNHVVGELGVEFGVRPKLLPTQQLWAEFEPDGTATITLHATGPRTPPACTCAVADLSTPSDPHATVRGRTDSACPQHGGSTRD